MPLPIPQFVLDRLTTDPELARCAIAQKAAYDDNLRLYAILIEESEKGTSKKAHEDALNNELKYPLSLEEIAYRIVIKERSDKIDQRLEKERLSHIAYEKAMEDHKKRLAKIKKPDIEVVIIPLENPKCPRCYMKLGIEDNFMSLCDRCCDILLESAEQLVHLGRLTIEECDLMVRGIKEGQRAQLEKYKCQTKIQEAQ